MYKIHAIVFSKVINVLQTNAHIKNAFTSNGNYCLIIILWYKGQTTQHINIKHIHILYTCFLLREIWKILSLILSFIFPTSEPDTSLRAQGFLQNVDTEQWQRRNFKKHPENILKEPIVSQKQHFEIILAPVIFYEDLLMWVFVLDGSQFIIRRCWEHRVDSPDNGRQIWRLIARVKLQVGRLQGKKSSTHLKKEKEKPAMLNPFKVIKIQYNITQR